MSILVYFDDQSFEISNPRRHDLMERVREKVGVERLAGPRIGGGHSTAHPKRYAENAVYPRKR
jgi:hypothetical protein